MIQRRSWRAICLTLIALFYVISIPWYRDPAAPLRIWFGLPDWVAIALLCYVGVAALNAAAWQLSDVSDELANDDEIQATSSGSHVVSDAADPSAAKEGAR